MKDFCKMAALFFLLLAVISCSKSNEKMKVSDTSNSINLSQHQSRKDSINNHVLIELEPIIEFERTNGDCFGQCPIYKVSIFSEGKVVFEGKQNVKNLGFTKSNLSKSKLKKLIAEFKDVDFFNLSDKYLPKENCPELWSDSPTISIYYRKENLSKTIYHYQGCKGNEELKRLFVLENNFDKIINTKQWIE